MNIFGSIVFSCYSDSYLALKLSQPLYKEEKSEINSNLLNNDKYKLKIDSISDDNLYQDNQERKNEQQLIDENEYLKKENEILKRENNELKSQNQSHIQLIHSLQAKIQNLEDLNQKLTEKIGILNEKENNFNGDELDNINP